MHAFLYWLLYQPALHALQKKTGIPHSDFCQHFGVLWSVLTLWVRAQVENQYSLAECQAILQETIDNPKFKGCLTLLIDGIQVQKWQSQDPAVREEQCSYKLGGCAACNFIVTTTPGKIITYVSPAFGAKHHDIQVRTQSPACDNGPAQPCQRHNRR